VAHQNGAGPDAAVTAIEARKDALGTRVVPSSRTPAPSQTHYSVSSGRTALGTIEVIDGRFVAVDTDGLVIVRNAAARGARLPIGRCAMTRRRLPNHRASMSFNFEVNGLTYVCTYSRFADGRVGEVFIGNHKSGSGADVNASDAAIAVSFALQHGADIQAIARALSRDPQGNPRGPLGRALDEIARGGR
jgi:hypothetical protein